MLGFYLSFKEVWRNRGRFFLFSMVIALITTLVLFIAALAEGLALSNKEYLGKLDAELFIFQSNVDTSISASRIGRSKLANIRRIEGVRDIGSVGFSSASMILPNGENQNISLLGVEPGAPGEPPALQGRNLETSRANEAVIDGRIAQRMGVRLGDRITLKTIQGTEENFSELEVVGITDGQQFLFAPSVFVPYRTWDRIRPQGANSAGLMEIVSNVVVVRLNNPADLQVVAQRLVDEVKDIEVVLPEDAIKALPGYSAQQSTLSTQQAFTLLIGVLVIGGFFQIQLLQKVPQIGVLKAIGTANGLVAQAVVAQIVLVTTFGVLLGGLVTALLAIALPASVPIVFSGTSVLIAIGLLLAIGPLGGLVSVRLAISVEPLIALGLQS